MNQANKYNYAVCTLMYSQWFAVGKNSDILTDQFPNKDLTRKSQISIRPKNRVEPISPHETQQKGKS